MAKIAKDADAGLCVDDARKALAPALQPNLSQARNTLLKLVAQGRTVPQVLLLEGGIEEERQAMALWWATLQHCQTRQAASPTHNSPSGNTPSISPVDYVNTDTFEAMPPCGQCNACLHIGMRIHADIVAYDGRISNTADLENPGPVRALNKENAQALKGKMGDTTRSGQKRVVIISGIDTTRSAAANALLKVLEEPSPTTIFVLLTAQREQILPTLVSRSWVYTLPWPKPHHVDAKLAPWESALATFMQRGTGWWDMTSGKGAVTQEVATHVLLLCQKRLMTTLAHTEQATHMASTAQGPLSMCFQHMNAHKRLTVTQYIDAAQEALQYNVTPGRVLDMLAVQLHTLYQRRD